jgi:hypothetical protein
LADTGYDACVEVSDIDAFVSCLLETGTVNGRPIHEVFSTVEHGKVEYAAREVELTRDLQSLGASPFRKAERYASQKEYRIVLRPHDEWLSDIQYVEIEPREGLLAVVARSEASLKQSPFDHSKQSVLASLTVLVREIEIFEQRSRQDATQQRRTYFSNRDVRNAIEAQSRQLREDEFKATFGSRVTDVYGNARGLGHRGVWEKILDEQMRGACWMVIEELKRLANDIEPNSYRLRS